MMASKVRAIGATIATARTSTVLSMADGSDGFNLAAVWRRMTEANLRYYSGYAKLTRDYIEEIVGSSRGTRRSTTSPLGATPARTASTAGAPARSPQPAMALAGKLGARPAATFVVENGLNRRVHAPLLASSFRGSDESERSIALTLKPEEIDLAPGDQLLVRVSARIQDDLELGVSYRGEVTAPGLPGARVALVVRREPGA